MSKLLSTFWQGRHSSVRKAVLIVGAAFLLTDQAGAQQAHMPLSGSLKLEPPCHAELLAASQEWAALSMRRSYLDGAGGLFMTWEDRLRTEADLVANKNRAEWRWRHAIEACK